MSALDNLLGFLWPSWQKSPIGKTVYFQETGEKIGTVINEVLKGNNEVIGYEVGDKSTGTVLYYPANQFEFARSGLILQPLWYTESMKLIRELELQETMIPEISSLIAESVLSKEDLQRMLSQKNPELRTLVDRALSLQTSLKSKLGKLEAEALKMKEQIVATTGDRLLGKDRKTFAERLLTYKRSANILDANIKRCRELLLRLETSPFLPTIDKITHPGTAMQGVPAAGAPSHAPAQAQGASVTPTITPEGTCTVFVDGKCPVDFSRKSLDSKPLRVVNMQRTLKNVENKLREKLFQEFSKKGLIKDGVDVNTAIAQINPYETIEKSDTEFVSRPRMAPADTVETGVEGVEEKPPAPATPAATAAPTPVAPRAPAEGEAPGGGLRAKLKRMGK